MPGMSTWVTDASALASARESKEPEEGMRCTNPVFRTAPMPSTMAA